MCVKHSVVFFSKLLARDRKGLEAEWFNLHHDKSVVISAPFVISASFKSSESLKSCFSVQINYEIFKNMIHLQ